MRGQFFNLSLISSKVQKIHISLGIRDNQTTGSAWDKSRNRTPAETLSSDLGIHLCEIKIGLESRNLVNVLYLSDHSINYSE